MIFAQFNDTAKLFQRQLVVVLSIEDLGILEMENMVLRLEHEDLLHTERCLSIPIACGVNNEVRDKIRGYRAHIILTEIRYFRVISPQKNLHQLFEVQVRQLQPTLKICVVDIQVLDQCRDGICWQSHGLQQHDLALGGKLNTRKDNKKKKRWSRSCPCFSLRWIQCFISEVHPWIYI